MQRHTNRTDAVLSLRRPRQNPNKHHRPRQPLEMVPPSRAGPRSVAGGVLRRRPGRYLRQEHSAGGELPQEVSVVHDESGQAPVRLDLRR